MRLASFNVENLFARAAALNSSEWVNEPQSHPSLWSAGRATLDACAKLNSILAQPNYGTQEKTKILDLLKNFGILDDDIGDYVILRRGFSSPLPSGRLASAVRWDRFGRQHKPARNQPSPAFILARENEERIAGRNRLTAIHRFLSAKRHPCRIAIANGSLDRGGHDQLQLFAVFSNPSRWTRTTEKRWPVGARMTTHRSMRLSTAAPSFSSRATSAEISSVLMSMCTRLSWLTRWI